MINKLCFLLLVLITSSSIAKAQWHDTIYFAAPYYGGSLETFSWQEYNDSVLLVPSSTQVGWNYIRRAMLSYYTPDGVKTKSIPMPNDFSSFSESESFYIGAFNDIGYMSSAIKDSSAYTYMNRLHFDTIMWRVANVFQPFSLPIESFNRRQAWFVDSINFLRVELENGLVHELLAKDSLLPDSIMGFDFNNYLPDDFDYQRGDTLTKYFSHYFYDISDRKSKRSIAVLKYVLAPLKLLAVGAYVYSYSNSGRGEGSVDNEFVNVKDSLVPNYADTTTERWLHIEKLSGERIRTLKMSGRFLRSGSNTYLLKAKTAVKDKYTLVLEECYFRDSMSPSGSSESCSRVLLFGKNNKLYYDKIFKGWGGLAENMVTKMSVNGNGEAYFRVTTSSNPNYASMLVKLDTTGAHQLFELFDDTSIHPLIDVNIHPNPFQNSIQIETSRVGDYRLRLYHLTGQLIANWQKQDKQFFTFNTEGIKPGLYLYQLENMRTGAVLQTGKLVKRE